MFERFDYLWLPDLRKVGSRQSAASQRMQANDKVEVSALPSASTFSSNSSNGMLPMVLFRRQSLLGAGQATVGRGARQASGNVLIAIPCLLFVRFVSFPGAFAASSVVLTASVALAMFVFPVRSSLFPFQ